MDITKKAILFDGKAIVNILDTTELVQQAIDFHSFNDLTAEAVAKTLTMTAFISGNFKSIGNKITVIIDGNGPIGKIVACGDTGALVRAYCENPNAKGSSVKEIVGQDGYLNVIKDFNMKEPYNGLSQLVNGNIAEDFAYYFTTSEQLPSAVACDAIIENGKCIKSGAVIVQPMPNCPDEVIVILEDIVRNFTNVSELLLEKGAEGILDYYFGHFEIKVLDDVYPKYVCSCSDDKIKNMLLSLGKKEALDIINQEGKIEVNCQFCGKSYCYYLEDVEEIFNGK